jgi:D-glycero-alpha-D-manno-heptose-7-phosphate kinase
VTAAPGAAPGAARRVVVARAPARLDFGGGWTDVPPYCDEQGGTVCNLAIARRATVRLADAAAAPPPLDAPGRAGADARLADAALRRAGLRGRVRAEVVSDFPVGAGLGGSSAAGVALAAAAAAWRGDPALGGADDGARRDALAEWSRAVEVDDAGIAGGRQDHYAAARGGALRLDFGAAAGGAPCRATPLPLSADTRAALERRLVVVYTGESRVSAATITGVLDAYRAREPRVTGALARMRALAAAMADATAGGDVDALGALVGEHWTHQRALHPAIPTARIDAIVAAGAAAGALGAKALGASGGGCVLLVAPHGGEARVREAVATLGEVMEWRVDEQGVTVGPGVEGAWTEGPPTD